MAKLFRADIEGLRAVALMSVLCFHIAPLKFTGGYIGVDVFFVISGYLITRGIVERVEAGAFSYMDFYARRIKRLFPAYLFVSLITFIPGFFLLFPHELVQLGETTLATVFYVSNIYFMLKTDYFNPTLEENPLLHTWSLSVEEQFYIVYPVILVFLLGGRRRILSLSLIAMAVASFVLGQILLDHNAAFAFFLSLTRFWQFLFGAALVFLPPVKLSGGVRDTLALSGLAAIALSVFILDDDTPVPGVQVVPATLGAALVILVGMTGPGFLTRLALGNPVASILGRISYSTYLVHWPIIVYFEMTVAFTNVPQKIGLLVASLALGAACWRFIEQPGVGVSLARPRAIIGAGLSGMAAVGVVAAVMIAAGGFESRFTPQQLAAAKILDEMQQAALREGDAAAGAANCFLNTRRETSIDLFDRTACLSTTGPRPHVLLMGDSHALHLVPGFESALGADRVGRVLANGCRPLLHGNGDVTCRALMREALDTYAREQRFDAIILAGRWRPDEIEAIGATAKELVSRGQTVFVVGPVVEYRKPLPRILALHAGDAHADASSSLSLLSEKTELDRKIARVVADAGARHVSALAALCPEGRCIQVASDGRPVQVDYGHLSRTGSIDLVGALLARGAFGALDAAP